MNYKTLTQAIGHTPMIKIPFNLPATMLAKLEYLNPGGSLKDRVALHMIEQAERTGKLKPGGTIIDASSGNMGIASAMIGAMKGYKVIITVSEKISTEKYQTLLSYGAEVIKCPVTDFIEDPRSYHAQAKKLAQKIPNSFMPDQYFNIENARAHYLSMGPEIWEQTAGTITHLFAAAGTGGHVSGVGQFLKEKNPAIKIIALDSVNSWRATNGKPKPYKLEGMGVDFESPVLNKQVIDEFLLVDDESAIAMLKTMACNYGLLLGPSSGAIIHGAYTYAQTLASDATCVMILGDSGRAYLTKNFYHQQQQTSETTEYMLKKPKLA